MTVAAGGTLTVNMPAATVPANASAVEVNVTAVNPAGAGYLDVYPTGSAPASPTSVVNFTKGQTVANSVLVGLGTGNDITVANGPATGGATDVLVDVLGYFTPQTVSSPSGTFVPLPAPARIADTRCFPSTKTYCSAENIPPANQDTSTLGPNGTQTIQATSVGGVPAVADVSDVLVTVTAVQPTENTFLSFYAGGGTPPGAGNEFSNMNLSAGETLAATAFVPVSTSGQITIYNLAGNTNVAVDVAGYISTAAGNTGSLFFPLASPVRVIGTTAAPSTVQPGASATAQGAGANGIPSNASAISTNLTDVTPTDGNFLTEFASDQKAPVASNVDWTPKDAYNVVANSAITGVSISVNGDAVPVGSFSVLNGPANTDNNAGSTGVDTDEFGYFAPIGPINVSANPATLPANGTSTSTITATVPNAPAGDTVRFTDSGTCGTLSPAPVLVTSGSASDTYTASSTAGICTITAQDAATGATATTTVTQTAYNHVVVSPATAAVPANGAATQTFTTTVTNGSGAAVVGDTVTFTLAGGASCGTVNPTSGTTNAAGQVTTTYTASTTSGFCTLTATEAADGGTGTATIDQTSSPTPANAPFAVTVAFGTSPVPANGTATSSLTATVKDAGVDVSGDEVVFSLAGTPATACGTLSSYSGTTNSSGQVTVTYTASTTAGTCTATATEADTGGSGTATITQSAVDTVAVTASPSAIPANGTSTSTITASVTNAAGTAVAGDTVTFSASPGSCGTFTTNPVVTGANGQAQTTYVSSTTTEFCTITASAAAIGGAPTATGNTVVDQTAPTSPSSLTVSASPASLPANGTTTSAITADVTGAGGAPVGGDSVLFTVSGTGCGTITGTNPATTGSNGEASTTYTASTTAGSCTVTAREADANLTGTTTITQTAFNTVLLTATPGNVPANGSSTSALSATVTSNGGTPVAGDTVTFTTAASPGGACGTVAPTSGTTNSSGTITATYTASTTSGFCTITATESGHGATDSTQIVQTANPAPADTPFTVTASPGSASTPANGTSTVTEVFTVDNSLGAGHPVVGDPIEVTETGGTACGTFSPTSGVTSASGQFTTTYTPSTGAGTCTFIGTEANDNQSSGTYTITQTAVRNVAVSATPSSIPANGTSTSTITATVTNGGGGVIAGDSVTFSASAGCGTFSTNPVVTNASGQATTTYTSSTNVQFCTITATDTTIAGSGNTTVDQTA